MLRRARAWAAGEISRLLRAEIGDARADLETSMQSRVDELAADVDRDTQRREQDIAASLDRLATSLDAISQQLTLVARDHRESVAAVDLVVREMAIAFMRADIAASSTVLGGTIEPAAVDITRDALGASEVLPRDGMGTNGDAPASNAAVTIGTGAVTIEPTGDSVVLHVGCIVEVRSRFQNRWVDGFEIAEILDHDRGVRYQLARHADHVRLPALFEANDLRPLDLVDDIVIDPEVDDAVDTRL